MSAVLTHPEITPERPDWLADDAVQIGPVSNPEFPENREINRFASGRACCMLNAAIRLFSPGTDPDAIPPKRSYRRTRYFAARELSRRCLDTLREASPTPMTTAQLTAIVMLAKGYPADDDAIKGIIAEMVVTILRRLCKRGSVVKSGTSRDAQWALAPSLI